MRFDHPLDPHDRAPAQANREARAATRHQRLGVDARAAFDARKAAIPAAEGVTVTAATVGGVPGCWCRPPNALPGAGVLFLHGGGYVMGSARAFANFAGQIAARAGADTFVADYRLAPEHPFPAGLEDAAAAYRGMVALGHGRIAISGDSAGGGLALALLARMTEAGPRPAAAAVMSPWVDMTLTADGFVTREADDPVFTREVLQDIADNYLGGADPRDPMASPLRGSLAGLPPVRIDIGGDEMLLDDAASYAARAEAAGGVASVHVWAGMPHVFQTGIGRYVAAAQSLAGLGGFLREHLRQDAGG